uniref:EF-hand domain-containing protein n=1 Tax=Anser cygnoides TaxID=8845 RepID=A0A8B9IQL1_ANSCY
MVKRPQVFKAPKKAKKKIEGGSNVFSMFEQTQIQEFKEAFTIMDQNRDGFIDKADLRDTFAALGRLNVKNEELEDMVKEAPGPINFTVFLTMFGEKLKGTDPEETILNAFKIFDPEGKGHIKADYIKEMLMTQADRFSQEEINQMFAAFPPDVSAYRARSKISQLWDGEQASKVVIVLHRSDGGKLTEDTGRKFRRKALGPRPAAGRAPAPSLEAPKVKKAHQIGLMHSAFQCYA